MAPNNTIIISGRFEHVKDACQFVADGAASCGLGEKAVFHIELACDEACTNIIEHGYEGENVGEIEVGWQLTEAGFEVTIRDRGRSFDPKAVPVPVPIEAAEADNANDLQVGGLGIHFMRNLMDEVRFEFDRVNGNTLVMVKTLSG